MYMSTIPIAYQRICWSFVQMIFHLGVSKAILNHVIFCHQEESAWYMYVCMYALHGWKFLPGENFCQALVGGIFTHYFFYWLHGNLNCIDENLFHWYVMYICRCKSSCAWQKFFLWKFLAISYEFNVEKYCTHHGMMQIYRKIWKFSCN